MVQILQSKLVLNVLNGEFEFPQSEKVSLQEAYLG